MASNFIYKVSFRECESQSTLKEFDYECPLCLDTLKDPFLATCCDTHFCEACIEAAKEKVDQCPHCKIKPINGTIDQAFQRLINEREVHCSQKEYGCLWLGKLSELDEHLNSDVDGCHYVLTPCPLSCEEEVCRCKLQQHLEEECQLRPYVCEFCNNYSFTFEDVTTQHYSKCPDFLMPCPNQCSDEKFKRSKLNEHLHTCPNEVVSCTFSEMGCKERMKRSLLQEHIETNMLHHQLIMCEAFKEIKKENDMLKRDSEELKVLQSAQNEPDYWINGYKRMAEGVKKTHWREYLTSLAVLSTNIPEPVSPIIFKWSNYDRMLSRAKEKGINSPFYYFRPFYTHRKGYKMQLRMYPNGADHGRDTHISLYCHLVNGENDDNLKWPFEGTVEVTLLNQVEDDKHYVQEIWDLQCLPYDVIKQPDPYQIRNESGWGQVEFIPLTEVKTFTPYKQYLMNDALYLQIITTTK